jgi:membrane glycosyltransferase
LGEAELNEGVGGGAKRVTWTSYLSVFMEMLLRLIFESLSMLLRASRIFNNLLGKNVACYGITPQFMHPLTAELLLD